MTFIGAMSQLLRDFRRRIDASKAAIIEPCLPTLAAKPPTRPGWIHEIKHDGFRLMVRKAADGVPLITRNGHIWTERFPMVIAAAEAIKSKSFLIDGEVVAVDDRGMVDFNRLRYGSRVNEGAFLYAFDLLELDGKDLKPEPLKARKAALAKLVHVNFLGLKRGRKNYHGAPAGIRYVDHLDDDGVLIFEHACALRCEGIVSKRLTSPYVSGRSKDWIKTKNPDAPAAKRLEEEDWNDRSRRSARP
jgi:bifunctional non-homologous end joining protein LigD